jgi:hypothetical protein
MIHHDLKGLAMIIVIITIILDLLALLVMINNTHIIIEKEIITHHHHQDTRKKTIMYHHHHQYPHQQRLPRMNPRIVTTNVNDKRKIEPEQVIEKQDVVSPLNQQSHTIQE